MFNLVFVVYFAKKSIMEYNTSLPKELFQKQLQQLLIHAWKTDKWNIKHSAFLAKTILRQRKASIKRKLNNSDEMSVPPIMILSTTNRCNLMCKGCYANNQHRITQNEMPTGRISLLFSEAEDLGTQIIMLDRKSVV